MRVLASAGAFLIAAMLLALHRLPIEKAALSLLEVRWHKADQLHLLYSLPEAENLPAEGHAGATCDHALLGADDHAAIERIATHK